MLQFVTNFFNTIQVLVKITKSEFIRVCFKNVSYAKSASTDASCVRNMALKYAAEKKGELKLVCFVLNAHCNRTLFPYYTLFPYCDHLIRLVSILYLYEVIHSFI